MLTRTLIAVILVYQGVGAFYSDPKTRRMFDAMLITWDISMFAFMDWIEAHGGKIFSGVGAFFGAILAIARTWDYFFNERPKQKKGHGAN